MSCFQCGIRVEPPEYMAVRSHSGSTLIHLHLACLTIFLQQLFTSLPLEETGNHLSVSHSALVCSLSATELRVLREIVDGSSNSEIGQYLGMRPHTVKNHVASILSKLGARSRTEAATTALQAGLGGRDDERPRPPAGNTTAAGSRLGCKRTVWTR